MLRIAFLSFVTLIAMVNPLAVIPAFVSMTDGPLRTHRKQVAMIAGLAIIAVLTLFLFFGNFVFKFFGITVPAFQIMGGIIFFSNALRTLMEDEHRIRDFPQPRDNEELPAAPPVTVDPFSIAVVPLAIPMLSGPGAITSTMLLVNLYREVDQKIGVVIGIIFVGIVSYLTLLAAVPLSHVIGERGRAVFKKVMALLLGAIGVQLVLNGLKPLIIEMVKAA